MHTEEIQKIEFPDHEAEDFADYFEKAFSYFRTSTLSITQIK